MSDKLTKQKWLSIKGNLTTYLEFSSIIYNYDIDEDLLNEICNDQNVSQKIWQDVCICKQLSNDFIRKNLKNIRWSMIIENDKINIENLTEFKNDIDYKNVLDFQNFMMDMVHASSGLKDLYDNNEKIINRFDYFINKFNKYINWKSLNKKDYCNRFLFSYKSYL